MFTTTVLITFQIVLVKRKPLWLALAFFIPFSFFDGELPCCLSMHFVISYVFLICRLVLGSGVEEDPSRCLGSVHDWSHLVCQTSRLRFFSKKFRHNCATGALR